jgi:hypothetical protein
MERSPLAHSDSILAIRTTRLVALLALLATSLFSATVDPASQRLPGGRAALDAFAFLPSPTLRTIEDGTALADEADRDGGPHEGPLDDSPGIVPSRFNPALSPHGSGQVENPAQLHGAVPAGHHFSPRAPPLV